MIIEDDVTEDLITPGDEEGNGSTAVQEYAKSLRELAGGVVQSNLIEDNLRSQLMQQRERCMQLEAAASDHLARLARASANERELEAEIVGTIRRSRQKISEVSEELQHALATSNELESECARLTTKLVEVEAERARLFAKLESADRNSEALQTALETINYRDVERARLLARLDDTGRELELLRKAHRRDPEPAEAVRLLALPPSVVEGTDLDQPPCLMIGTGGARDEVGLITSRSNAEGHLFYGPYLNLAPGSYVARFEFFVNSRDITASPKLTVDVADQTKSIALKRIRLRSRVARINLPFTVVRRDRPSSIETRASNPRGAKITLIGYELACRTGWYSTIPLYRGWALTPKSRASTDP